jgi:hypothetical protein
MNPYRCETCKNGQCTAQLQGGVIDIPFHDFNYVTGLMGCASHSDFQNKRETVLYEYNDELLTKLVQELAGTWRMRDAKLFSIIRKYRRVPIGAMKAELRKSKGGAP